MTSTDTSFVEIPLSSCWWPCLNVADLCRRWRLKDDVYSSILESLPLPLIFAYMHMHMARIGGSYGASSSLLPSTVKRRLDLVCFSDQLALVERAFASEAFIWTFSEVSGDDDDWPK